VLTGVRPTGTFEPLLRMRPVAREFMNTKEVADYLRIKQRKVYALLRAKRIPCSRVTGKWLFPKHLIDLWVAENTDYAGLGFETRPPAPVVAGSHDPLLDWAVGESGCGLALRASGSLDGLKQLAAGEAVMAGLHVRDEKTGEYNAPVVRDAAGLRDVVLIHWAQRRQGLVLAAGNPLKIRRIADAARKKARFMLRQPSAGSHLLLLNLLAAARLRPADMDFVHPPVLSETDVGLAIVEGRADAGLAIEAVARRFRLTFVPLAEERFDLAMRRKSYFEAPAQKLFAFAGTTAFKRRAAALGGYDVGGTGRVVWNG
jgi:putative molybdopterin biosynthesis protein